MIIHKTRVPKIYDFENILKSAIMAHDSEIYIIANLCILSKSVAQQLKFMIMNFTKIFAKSEYMRQLSLESAYRSELLFQ